MNTYIHLKQPTEAETSASLYLLGFDSFLFSSDSLVLGSLVYIASGLVAKTLLFAQLGPDTLGIEQGNKILV